MIVTPKGYDRNLAVESAELVNQAYDQYDAFLNNTHWSIQGNYDSFHLLEAKPGGIFPKVEPFGFVARNKTSNDVFVTFRGTRSLDDWISNLGFPHTAHPWGNVYKGFDEIYLQCSADVIAAVSGVSKPARVIATGHSLGGALSTLAAADVRINGIAVGLYNFASPRTGDQAFAAQFNSEVTPAIRVVNSEDIVTTIPLATTKLSGASLGLLLDELLRHAGSLDYQHVGDAATFTLNRGSIADNHNMRTTYLPNL
jgi:triacylglycerol lipase